MTDTAGRTSLARSTAVMAVGTLLSRLTGFGRVFALGYALNFSRLTDTYNLANNAPNIIYELVLGGVLSATLVPVFVQRFNSESESDAWESVSAICTAAFTVLLAVTLVLFFASPLIIDLYTVGNSTNSVATQRHVATELLRMFAPQVAIYGFISVATGLLQAKRKFGPPMFAPIFNNIVVIAVLLALPHLTHDISLEAIQNNQKALYFLGFGTSAGVLAMGLLLVPYVVKQGKGHLRWLWNPRHEAVKTVVRLSGWTAGFVATNQIALWVTLVLANGKSGDVSAFLSAYTFFILPHGIFTVSVMSALQPELAERWTRKDITAFRSQVVVGLRLVAVVLVPAAVGYAVLSRPITEAILLHGRLSLNSAHTTASVLMWMAIGLPGFSAFVYLTRVFQAIQDAKTVFYLYALENGVNVVTALSLYPAMGVNGLALSQTLAYAIAAVVALWALRSRTQGLLGRVLISSISKISAATAAMGVVVYVVSHVVGSSSVGGGNVVRVVAAIAAGAVVYLGLARILRISELQLLLHPRTKQS